jgi:release factor glutamine methyltransferase
MTLLEVLRSSTEYFSKREIENPRLNAELLLAHSLGRKRIELYLDFERVLSEPELVPLRELLRRRAQGEPLQHLVGTVEFLGREFACDKRALVPRPETEELVELVKTRIEADLGEATIQPGKQISPTSARERNQKSSRDAGGGAAGLSIVDVGTGSGIIAISLALAFPEAEIVAIDVSDDAIALARENSARFSLGERIRFVKGELLNDLAGQFDAIVANLPYVGLADRDTLAREVLHDPEVALFGGEKGDELIRELIEKAPTSLRPNGLLALEIGLGQADALRASLEEKNYHDIESKNDYAGIIRFLLARYG